MLNVRIFSLGLLNENCYLVSDTEQNKSFLVDPGEVSKELSNEINSLSGGVDYILLTHGHFDHIGGVAKYKELTGAKVVISSQEKAFPGNPSLNLGRNTKAFEVDILVDEGDKIPFGKEIIHVIHTPGHTVGSVCYLIEDKIFSGDTIFCGCTGRCDFPTGDSTMMQESLRKLSLFEDKYTVYPGHNETTTLAKEKINGCLSIV